MSSVTEVPSFECLGPVTISLANIKSKYGSQRILVARTEEGRHYTLTTSGGHPIGLCPMSEDAQETLEEASSVVAAG